MRKKSSFRKIPRSQWAVPVPKHPSGEKWSDRVGDTPYNASYEDVAQALLEMGFERLSETESCTHAYLRGNENRALELHSLWAHPAGVFINMSSYGMVEKRPEHRKLSSGHIYAEIDAGTSWDRYRSMAELNGSGSTYPSLDGRNIYNRSYTFGGYNGRLFDLLEKIQSRARFLPFDQWKDTQLYISGEFIYPLAGQPREGKEAQELIEENQQDFQKHLEDIAIRAPKGLGEKIRESFDRLKPIKMHDQVWHRIEDTINYYTHTLSAGDVIWPKPKQQDILVHWAERINDYGAVVNDKTDRVYEEGPCGINFASALWHSASRGGNEQRFLDFLQRADAASLEKWVRIPDAGGKTLLSHIFCHATDPNAHMALDQWRDKAPGQDLVKKTLDVLASRVDLKGLPLSLEGFDVVPWLHEKLKKNSEDRSIVWIDRVQAVVQEFENAGVAWTQGPAGPEGWREFFHSLPPRAQGCVGSIMALLDQRELEQNVEVVEHSLRPRVRF